MTDAVETDGTFKGERIAKRLARAGLCSRRDAERWIAEGRVAIDGVVLTSPAVNVDEGSIVMVDGKPLPDAAPTRLWRYHKPAGLVTSHRDEKGRATLFETLPAELGRVISVGRLDLTSEGLLLLTNDGALARRLELPAMGWIRRYKVRVNGYVDPVKLLPLERGPTIEGIKYGPIKVELERQKGANAWLTVSLTEGKNREIRRVFEHLGYAVNRLIRLSYGPFQLGSLAVGTVEEVPRKVLAEQLGDKAPTHARAKPVAKRPSTPKPVLPDHSPGHKPAARKAKSGPRPSTPPSTRNRDADRRR